MNQKAQKTQFKILLVMSGLSRGGAETSIVRLLKIFENDPKYHFDVMITGDGTSYFQDVRAMGTGIICNKKKKGLFSETRAILNYFRYFRKYDVVHSNLLLYSGLIVFIAKMCGVTTRISHLRSSNESRRNSLARKMYRMLMLFLMKGNSTHIVSVAEYIFDVYKITDSKRYKKVVLYNPIDIEVSKTSFPKPEKPANRIIISILASFREPKNHALFVQVARALSQKTDRYLFYFIGDGILRESIETKCKSYGIYDKCFFAGNVPNVKDYFKITDLMVSPSLWEGLPGAVLEALNANVLVVASNIPAHREIMNNSCGLTIVDDFEVDAYVKAIENSIATGHAKLKENIFSKKVFKDRYETILCKR